MGSDLNVESRARSKFRASTLSSVNVDGVPSEAIVRVNACEDCKD